METFPTVHMKVTAPGEYQGRLIPFRPRYDLACDIAGYFPAGAVVQLCTAGGYMEADVAPALERRVDLNEHLGQSCIATIAPSYVAENRLPGYPLFQERRRRLHRQMFGDGRPATCVVDVRFLDPAPGPYEWCKRSDGSWTAIGTGGTIHLTPRPLLMEGHVEWTYLFMRADGVAGSGSLRAQDAMRAALAAEHAAATTATVDHS